MSLFRAIVTAALARATAALAQSVSLAVGVPAGDEEDPAQPVTAAVRIRCQIVAPLFLAGADASDD